MPAPSTMWRLLTRLDADLLATVLAPIQVGKRWVVERANSWMNGHGKIRRRADRDAKVVDFYLYLAAALITARQLIRRARALYRWDTRPATRRLR